MIATAFDEENSVLHPPPGVSPEEVSALSTWRGKLEDGTQVVISCWKPTPEEFAEMRSTGRVWVMVLGETMPPLVPLGESPWKNDGRPKPETCK